MIYFHSWYEVQQFPHKLVQISNAQFWYDLEASSIHNSWELFIYVCEYDGSRSIADEHSLLLNWADEQFYMLIAFKLIEV
jgi:hypothetical protein